MQIFLEIYLHGVEGFAGSPVNRAVVIEKPTAAADGQLQIKTAA
jgi:hypothetical protein